MSHPSAADLDAVTAAARHRLADGWTPWPGGHPHDIELALIDAVFSIRARYGHPASASGAATGVPAIVARWRDHRGRSADDLRAIVQAGDEFASIIRNRSVTRGRTKVSAVQEAAQRLTETEICSAADFVGQLDVARRAYVGVRGLGGVTFSYLSMQMGVPDVKADVWITRFVKEAVGHNVSACDASSLVHVAAERFAAEGDSTMPQDASSLDHAIWNATREDAKSGRSDARA